MPARLQGCTHDAGLLGPLLPGKPGITSDGTSGKASRPHAAPVHWWRPRQEPATQQLPACQTVCPGSDMEKITQRRCRRCAARGWQRVQGGGCRCMGGGQKWHGARRGTKRQFWGRKQGKGEGLGMARSVAGSIKSDTKWPRLKNGQRLGAAGAQWERMRGLPSNWRRRLSTPLEGGVMGSAWQRAGRAGHRGCARNVDGLGAMGGRYTGRRGSWGQFTSDSALDSVAARWRKAGKGGGAGDGLTAGQHRGAANR